MATVLERGDIGFFWKPSVMPADALPGETPPAVQSFFLVLVGADDEPERELGIDVLAA